MSYRVEMRRRAKEAELVKGDLSLVTARALAVDAAREEPGVAFVVVNEQSGEAVWDTLCSNGDEWGHPWSKKEPEKAADDHEPDEEDAAP